MLRVALNALYDNESPRDRVTAVLGDLAQVLAVQVNTSLC